MPTEIVHLPVLIAGTSGGASFTNAVPVDDAFSFTIYVTSSATAGSYRLEVSPLKYAVTTTANQLTTAFYPLIAAPVTSSVAVSTGGIHVAPGTALSIENRLGFAQVRISCSSGPDPVGTTLAFVTKAIVI